MEGRQHPVAFHALTSASEPVLMTRQDMTIQDSASLDITSQEMARQSRQNALYRTIWRWHFYAGVFVIPFILILSVTGAVFLFKPQIERWEERSFQGLPMANRVSPSAQLDAVMAAYPDAQFHSYRLPERAGDAAMVHLAMADGERMLDVFVSPQGEVLGVLDPDSRIIAIDRDIHGQLLLGKRGSWLVELAASWAIVMIVTGLYLWWPRGRGAAGVVWPRLSLGKRAFWRDIHAVTGFWVAGLALVLLVSGLPWAAAWGSAFKTVRAEMGWVNSAPQDWTIGGEAAPKPAMGGGEHAAHDHGAMMRARPANGSTAMLNGMVVAAEAAQLAFPVVVSPPGTQSWSAAADTPAWTIRSDSQNRPLRTTITYDASDGRLLAQEIFSDKHPIDQVIGYGIAWHEGHLLGWFNQLVGVLTTLALILMAVSGFIMWRRRKPEAELGAPRECRAPASLKGVALITLIMACVLPLLGLSLIALLLVEKLVLPLLPGVQSWLGIKPRGLVNAGAAA